MTMLIKNHSNRTKSAVASTRSTSAGSEVNYSSLQRVHSNVVSSLRTKNVCIWVFGVFCVLFNCSGAASEFGDIADNCSDRELPDESLSEFESDYDWYKSFFQEYEPKVHEKCSDLVTSGCAVHYYDLNNPHACENCPVNHTICACKECFVYGPDCTKHVGVCRPKLEKYPIVTRCKYGHNQKSFNYKNTLKSVGCYCDIGNSLDVNSDVSKRFNSLRNLGFHRQDKWSHL